MAVLPPAFEAVKAYSGRRLRFLSCLTAVVAGAASGCVFAPERLDGEDLERLDAQVVYPEDGSTVDGYAPVVIRLDAPWDPQRSNPEALVVVTSGGVRMFGRTETSLTDLEVRFDPIEPWPDDLTWTIELRGAALRGLDGRSARVPDPIRFDALPPASSRPPVAEPRSFASDVAPLFAGCAGCHDGVDQIELDAQTMVDRRSQSVPGRWLVLAGEPARSVLLNKLVDHPVARFGAAMPPPWSDVPPLDAAAVRTVERWIADGALP